MQRRRALAVLGTALAPGCLRLQEGQATPGGEAADGGDAGGPDGGDAGAVELVSVSLPDTVELYEDYDVNLVFENDGTGGATVETVLEARPREGDRDWYEFADVDLEVPAGDTATWRDTFWHANVETVAVRVAGYGESNGFDCEPATRPFGEPVVLRDHGFRISADLVRATSTEYEADGAIEDLPAPAGREFAFVPLEIENLADRAATLPDGTQFGVLHGDEVHRPVDEVDGVSVERFVVPGDRDPLDPTAEIPSGEVIEPWVVALVPADATDVRVGWRVPVDGRGDQIALWTE